MKESLDIDILLCENYNEYTEHIVMYMEKVNGNFDKLTVCQVCELSTKKEVKNV